jgi:nucleoside-diphosphate-sugar epimerase
MAKLIFGCGYLGRRVAKRWLAAGEVVYAVTRTPERAAELAAIGLRPIVGDVAGPSQLVLPTDVTTALFAVGYDRNSAQAIGDIYAGGVARAIDSLPMSIERFLYISSTGVYGQVAGSEVDETSPCQPTREGGQACLAAEDALRTSRFADRAIILRLAGIYGPGRIPRSSDLLAGKPIDAPAAGWLNLIHVEDAAAIVLLAEQNAPLPSNYVVSDGQPVIRGEYYRELARLLGAPPPQFTTPAEGSPAAGRAASDKRVNPAKMFAELQPRLSYPSYREGLAAILAGTSIAP